ncbi:hypothetical protein F4677DRAFT_446380 [Hypoxylon crocopeplum]|nr:hypothetical protein F4677DRAFT_446380 [Hypoxylon crocopeplum]
MANWIFNVGVLGALFVLSIVTTPIAILTIALRFVSTSRSGRKFGREDWLAFAATVVHVIYCALTLASKGRNVWVLTMDEALIVGKLAYATAPLFVFNQLFAKFSILFLYIRIFGVNRTYRWCIWGISAVHIGYCISTLYIYFFSCRPISKAWDTLAPGYCLDYLATVTGCETVNSGVDLALVALALWMIQELRMDRTTKLRLSLIFALGGFAGVVGFVKIGESYRGDPTINFLTGAWTIAQMAVSIICCCAPVYKPILPTEGFGRLLSTMAGYTWSRVSRSIRSKASNASLPQSQASSNKNGDGQQEWLSNYQELHSSGGTYWSEVEHDPRAHLSAQGGYPMKTVSVKQSTSPA